MCWSSRDERQVGDSEGLTGAAFGSMPLTTSVIGSGALALLRYPDMRETCGASPGLVPVAAEEFLRLESPVQYLT
jgi:cytochrome P450